MASERKVTIPEGVKVELEGTLLKVKGPKGQLERSVRFPQITTVLADNTVIFSTNSDRKSVIAMVGTFAAHTKNMCHGVTTPVVTPWHIFLV
ncbi:MAG TPA: 50S ribosomal protein L6, partial [Methanoregulaceae archaeon]|nr:50S ribosomal protein L6 [Methanoregulaceae archaeon]